MSHYRCRRCRRVAHFFDRQHGFRWRSGTFSVPPPRGFGTHRMTSIRDRSRRRTRDGAITKRQKRCANAKIDEHQACSLMLSLLTSLQPMMVIIIIMKNGRRWRMFGVYPTTWRNSEMCVRHQEWQKSRVWICQCNFLSTTDSSSPYIGIQQLQQHFHDV